jgi:hypothetical protein
MIIQNFKNRENELKESFLLLKKKSQDSEGIIFLITSLNSGLGIFIQT